MAGYLLVYIIPDPISALPPTFHRSMNTGIQATPSSVSRASEPRPRASAPKDREVLLKEELTVDNYVEKFHALLDVEQEEHKVQLEKGEY